MKAPRFWEVREGWFFGVTHPLLIALLSGALTALLVPASVWTQKIITRISNAKHGSAREEDVSSFKKFSATAKPLAAKRDFGFFYLRVVFLGYGIYFCYLVTAILVNGRDLPVMAMYFLNPAQTLNTFAKLILMLSVANVGAFNQNIRREAVIAVGIGHAVSVGASLWFYLGFPPNPVFPEHHPFMLASIIADGLIVVIAPFLIFIRPTLARKSIAEEFESRAHPSILNRKIYLILGVMWLLYSLVMAWLRLSADPNAMLGAIFSGPDPLVSNSLTKYITLVTLGLLLFANPAVRKYFLTVLAVAFSVTVLAGLFYSLQGSTMIITRTGGFVTVPGIIALQLLVEGGILLLVLRLRRIESAGKA
ncbi:MAG: hypothetical protein AAB354_08835 [candidate division KSB1 bacterium]